MVMIFKFCQKLLLAVFVIVFAVPGCTGKSDSFSSSPGNPNSATPDHNINASGFGGIIKILQLIQEILPGVPGVKVTVHALNLKPEATLIFSDGQSCQLEQLDADKYSCHLANRVQDVTSVAVKNKGQEAVVVTVETPTPLENVVESPTQEQQVKIFVSAQTWTSANMGGISGADATCLSEATAAGVTGSWPTWKALLSTSTTSAKDRLTVDGPIYNFRPEVNGGPQRIATSLANLWSGSIENPVMYTSSGGIVSSHYIYTGTDTDGSKANGYDTCGDWTSSIGTTRTGLADYSNSWWIQHSFVPCNGNGLQLHIFCISQ